MRKNNQILTMYVDDEFGVLTRITGQIRREGLNINALSVSQTTTPGISRMSVHVTMQGFTIDQVVDRLKRLNCVKKISVCTSETHIQRELALIVCSADSSLYQGHPVLWENESCVCFELTATPEELDQYLSQNADDGLLEFFRSGVVTMKKEDLSSEFAN